MIKISFILTFIFLWHWNESQGCDCLDASIFSNWQENELIFKAEAIYTSPYLSHSYHSKLFYTDLLVKEVFKGELIKKGDTLSVWNFRTSCDYLFNISEDYLVFADPYILQGVNICSGTMPWNNNFRSTVLDSIHFYNKNYIDTITNLVTSNIHHFPKYKLLSDKNSKKEQHKYVIILLYFSLLLNVSLIILLIIKILRHSRS